MPNVSTGALRRALKNFDWESFLQSAGLDVQERNGEVAGECPYCHHKRTSFYVKVGVGIWKCHFCNESGWALRLIEKVTRCTTQEALDRIMAHRTSVYSDDEWEVVEEEEPPPVIELPEGFHLLAESNGETAQRYRAYALTRMTTSQIVEYKVGFCATGYYRGRIVVPVYHLGSLVNWVARAISATNPKKVLTPPGNEQYSYVFNLEKIWGHDTAVVTEGVFDCLAAGNKAVATFGKKITDTQVNVLIDAGVRHLILTWDSDAQQEIWDNFNQLRMAFDSVLVVELPTGADPASIGHNGMVELLKTAHAPRRLTKDSAGTMNAEVEI